MLDTPLELLMSSCCYIDVTSNVDSHARLGLEFDRNFPVFEHFSCQIRVKIQQNRFVKRFNIFIKCGFDVLQFFQNVIILVI